MAALYALAVVVLTLYGSNLLWMSWHFARHDRQAPGPVREPGLPPLPLEHWPTVTVQIPLYNEPFVAERVIAAAARLDYPASRLEIQVLDDSTDATGQIVEACVGDLRRKGVEIVHVRRSHREGYKAGALRNGLSMAGGDFVAIFDADFVPPDDFLRRMLPEFSSEGIGMVQARWSHINARASWLTRIQTLGLDAHFAVEQRVRNVTGCFMNFNGTAGIWRRRCIEESGGWQGDTLAEDLDLSYRAQLVGWQFRYVGDVEAPAQLPATMSALRSQQFRWAKGSIETAFKVLRPLLHSETALRTRVQGTFHLTGHLVFPFVLMAVLLHAPLLLMRGSANGPAALYFGLLAFGLVGFVGFSLAQLFAQRELYPDWGRRVAFVPAFMAGTIGLSLSNTSAVIQGLRRKPSAFVRTPKRDLDDLREKAEASRPPIVWIELALLVYALAGFVGLFEAGEWAALPFQALFAGGFGLVTIANFRR